jgi:putative PEP-CTERM system TPR-repeat lipoprotein
VTGCSPRFLIALAATVVVLAGCDRFTSVDTRLARAASNLEAGEFQAALIDLRKSLDAEPHNVKAQLLMADVLEAWGDSAGAQVLLDRAVATGAPPAAVEPRALDLLLARGEAEAVRSALTASKTLPPAQRDTYEGQLAMLENRPAEAQAAFDRAIAADPALIEPMLGRVDSLAAQGQFDVASQEMDAFLKRNPQSGRGWLLKGTLAARAGDSAGAAAAFATAIERNRGMSRQQRVQAHVARLESLLAQGQLDAARSALAALKAVAGDMPIVSLMRARLALADGDTSTAVNELRNFTRAAPQHMPGRLLLVAALQEQGNLEQAFGEAARTVSEFAGKDEPRLALASVQLSMGRAADAEETLRPLIAQSPPNPMAIAILAEIRMRSGDSDAGILLMEQGVARNSGNPGLKLQLAAAYLSTGDARRALQVLDTVTGQDMSAARDRLHAIATAALQGASSVARELEAATKRHPEDIDLVLMAVAYAANSGHLDEARDQLHRALQAHPHNLPLLQALARLEISAGRPAEAEKLVKEALEKAPDDPVLMAMMAAIAGQRGQESEVDAWLSRARMANPGSLGVSLALARRAMVRGEPAEARRILSEAVRQSPTDVEARVVLAELVASQGDATQAIAQLRTAAVQFPDSPLIPLSMSRIQLAAKDTAAARTSLQKALNLSPGWLPAASALAVLEARSGRLQAALDVVHDVRQNNPGSSADFLEGEVYLAAKLPARAARAYALAYQNKPGSAVAVRALQAKIQAKQDAPASEVQDWLKRTPADSAARRALGEYYLSAGRNREAISELEQVVAARPTDGMALNNLAWLYHQEGNPLALATAEKAHAMLQDSPEVADTFGWLLVQSHRLEEGLKVLKTAAQQAPSNPQIQFHLAYALAELDHDEEAIAILRQLTGAGVDSATRAQAKQLLAKLKG